MNTPTPETYGLRLEKYERRNSMSIWVAAGLGGLLLLLSSNTIQGAPSFLMASIITVLIIGGGALGMTRVMFEWEATRMKRMFKYSGVKRTDSLPDTPEWKWPRIAERFWNFSLMMIITAGLLTICASWWNPVTSLFHFLGRFV